MVRRKVKVEDPERTPRRSFFPDTSADSYFFDQGGPFRRRATGRRGRRQLADFHAIRAREEHTAVGGTSLHCKSAARRRASPVVRLPPGASDCRCEYRQSSSGSTELVGNRQRQG